MPLNLIPVNCPVALMCEFATLGAFAFAVGDFRLDTLVGVVCRFVTWLLCPVVARRARRA